MKSISAPFFLGSLLALSSLSRSRAAVIDLTDATFEHQTQASTGQTTGKWFIKFYAPWCGHCKTLAPIWEELDERLREDNPQDGIVVARVDATKETQVAKRFKVQSYPTLKYFADRKMYSYDGARNIDALYDFAAGGYRSENDDAIPTGPSAFETKMKELRQKFGDMLKDHPDLKYLLEDFDHIVEYRKNAAAVLLVGGACVGFFFGVILSLLMGMGSASAEKKAQKKKKKE